MTSTSTRTLALFAGLALVACGAREEPAGAVPAVDQTVQAASQRPAVPVLDWAPCGEEFPGTECAVAEVPLDYDRPRGETTFIALARIPASDRANRVGSVFINPGGPGGSGVDFVLSGAPDYAYPPFGELLGTSLQGRFDIVGFDPRGVARSDPLHCFDTLDEENSWWSPVPYFPYSKDQERKFFDDYRWFTAQCLGHGQRILSHMSTADVARDLDLLRQAVGDKRINYLGFSYGSYVGETYASLFPDKVRALVIDGVVDPRFYSSGSHIVYDAVAAGKAFKEFLRLCDEAHAVDPSYCLLSGPGGAGARYDELATRLKEQPYECFPFTYDWLVAATSGALYVPEFWAGPDGYAAWFAEIHDLCLGDSTAARHVADIGRAIGDRLADASRQQEDYANGFDAFVGNMCADAEYPRLLPVWSAVGAFSQLGSIFGPMWWWSSMPCAEWPAAPDRYVGPWTPHTSAPVLVVGNHFDPATSYDSAVATSRLLPNSRLLSYAGWGHTAFARSDCVAGHVVGYLLDGVLPPTGTVCPAPPNPYLPQPATLRAATPARPLVGLPPPWLLRR